MRTLSFYWESDKAAIRASWKYLTSRRAFLFDVLTFPLGAAIYFWWRGSGAVLDELLVLTAFTVAPIVATSLVVTVFYIAVMPARLHLAFVVESAAALRTSQTEASTARAELARLSESPDKKLSAIRRALRAFA